MERWIPETVEIRVKRSTLNHLRAVLGSDEDSTPASIIQELLDRSVNETRDGGREDGGGNLSERWLEIGEAVDIMKIYLLRKVSVESTGEEDSMRFVEKMGSALEEIERLSTFASYYTSPPQVAVIGPKLPAQEKLCEIQALDSSRRVPGLLALMVQDPMFPWGAFGAGRRDRDNDELIGKVLKCMLEADEGTLLHPEVLRKVATALRDTKRTSNMIRHHGTPGLFALLRVLEMIDQLVPNEDLNVHLPELVKMATKKVENDEQKNAVYVEQVHDPVTQKKLRSTPTKSKAALEA